MDFFLTKSVDLWHKQLLQNQTNDSAQLRVWAYPGAELGLLWGFVKGHEA